MKLHLKIQSNTSSSSVAGTINCVAQIINRCALIVVSNHYRNTGCYSCWKSAWCYHAQLFKLPVLPAPFELLLVFPLPLHPTTVAARSGVTHLISLLYCITLTLLRNYKNKAFVKMLYHIDMTYSTFYYNLGAMHNHKNDD